MDASDEPVEEVERPLGLRMALAFLRIAAFAMLVPVLGALIYAGACLARGSVAKHPSTSDFAACGISLVGLLMAIMTTLGVMWLDGHLTGQWTQGASSQPVNPGRLMSLLPLGFVACHGFAAVALWTVSGLANGFHGFAWPLLWGLVGAGAGILYRYIDTKLP